MALSDHSARTLLRMYRFLMQIEPQLRGNRELLIEAAVLRSSVAQLVDAYVPVVQKNRLRREMTPEGPDAA